MKRRGWDAVWVRVRAVRMWARRRLPPGVRLAVGLALIVGGAFGFLPVLGFWMIPLGLAVAAADVLPIWRWFRGR
ncbi:hypothetical protein RXV86_03100 [Alisedimentitalea sp. MJ-SS2]|uniref:hypothetical protein n=1 Tax=Aliisedimentitalea sp. MJ-SS2 TaxID=3049795 RepID=UPI00290C9CCB|nr:hypothetical protein [Alisedimentitalea sp. MJ-SS2]MDU8926363.1 hypothetical protein [Alisedimentitalea sp. MJ-SS2]